MVVCNICEWLVKFIYCSKLKYKYKRYSLCSHVTWRYENKTNRVKRTWSAVSTELNYVKFRSNQESRKKKDYLLLLLNELTLIITEESQILVQSMMEEKWFYILNRNRSQQIENNLSVNADGLRLNLCCPCEIHFSPWTRKNTQPIGYLWLISVQVKWASI